MKEIYTELISMMEEEYSFLTTVFSGKKAPASAAAASLPTGPAASTAAATSPPSAPAPLPTGPPPAAAPVTEEISTGLPKIRSDTKIKIVKKASDSTVAPEPPQPPQPPQLPQLPQPPQLPQQAAQMYDPKDLKKWQKGQEQAKHAQLLATGVQPESLLTVDAMRTWIQTEGRTYAYVAREHVGLPEAVVAAFAKKHAITSSITKKRAIMASRKPRA
jgi:hypothetical protein